jgi:hypothetical protein
VTGGRTAPVASQAWVGCLVLAVAPAAYMGRVAAGVKRAEQRILDDPILVDTARVAIAATDDPLAGELDDMAHTLYRELLGWAVSPGNPAPRTTFCVLVVHPDPGEADRLVHGLAVTRTLSQLPVTFQIAGPEAAGATEDEMVRLVLDAVDATAHRLEQAPGVCLSREKLEELAARSHDEPPAAASMVAAATAPPTKTRKWTRTKTKTKATSGGATSVELAWQTVPDSDARPAGTPPPDRSAGRHAVPAAAEPEQDSDAAAAARRPQSRSDGGEDGDDRSALGRLVGSARSALSRRPVPSSNVEVIEELSSRSDRVQMLYVVSVSEPVRPSRADRARRTEVALELTRALGSSDEGEAGSWYVRAFTADRNLRPADPLPAPEVLRRRDFPERWGEHFVLFTCVGELVATIERDVSSFIRRGGRKPDVFVVFLAGKLPSVSASRDRPLNRLAEAAVPIWVSFEPKPPTPDATSESSVYYLRDHEDVVDQLCQVLLGRGAVHSD